jgi:phosphonate transport system substrate-binding protein
VRLSVSGEPVSAAPATADRLPLRVAVAAVSSPKGTLQSYGALFDYLAEKLERPVELIQRGTYAEINDLIRSANIDLAFICTNAYVQGHREFGLELLATPQVRGQPVYYSYIIVPADSQAKSLADLRGRVFAFTDPMSHTGRLVPTYLLGQMGETPDSFFSSYLFTYSHDNAIKAVADRLVDGAAVDSLVYDFAVARDPEIAARTRVIYKSPAYAAPPVVVHPALNPQLKAQLQELFVTMHQDEKGRQILQDLLIDRFVVLGDEAYDSVRQVVEAVRSGK